MLTNLAVRNFKGLGEVEIELGSPVVFIGPNNSGKTSAMQALALWDIGLKRWLERRGHTESLSGRSQRGVAVNRRDLVSIPVPNARLLWRGLHVRNSFREEGRQRNENVLVNITVSGVNGGAEWNCGLEFDYANEESFYCRPLRTADGHRMSVPEEAGTVQVSFLPPMSGLAATETRLDAGAVNVRIGEGRTAEVLRNLCYRIEQENHALWGQLVAQIEGLFLATLEPPRYVAERGEIVMNYRERGVSLDLSSSGRGLQQTLLILAYMYANPGAVLLLDEPDAHLEILRQRHIYQLISDVADQSGSQIIAASHSEVLLTEAADRDMVIAFVGRPHRMDDRGSQVLKSLRDIGFDQYYQAEQTGWVLYLEGSTDLSILRTFARRLDHERALKALERPFVSYVENQPGRARNHYYGLREAIPGLRGVALFDRLEMDTDGGGRLEICTWQRREIENYFCTRTTLEVYAQASAEADSHGPLFAVGEKPRRLQAMNDSITEIEGAMLTLGQGSPWDEGVKVSDIFLTPLFRSFFQKLNLPNLMNKKDFYELANYIPIEEISPEVIEKLDAIAATAESATPAVNEN